MKNMYIRMPYHIHYYVTICFIYIVFNLNKLMPRSGKMFPLLIFGKLMW